MTRCPSCGFVHGEGADIPAPVPVAPIVRPIVPVVLPVPQEIRCPLCGELFTDGSLYGSHRGRDCQPLPETRPSEPVSLEIPITEGLPHEVE